MDNYLMQDNVKYTFNETRYLSKFIYYTMTFVMTIIGTVNSEIVYCVEQVDLELDLMASSPVFAHSEGATNGWSTDTESDGPPGGM